jgi:hypothetical protein
MRREIATSRGAASASFLSFVLIPPIRFLTTFHRMAAPGGPSPVEETVVPVFHDSDSLDVEVRFFTRVLRSVVAAK